MAATKGNGVFAEWMVGLFMVAVLAILVYFTIIISGVEMINGKSKIRRLAEFSDVGGLKLRDNVVMRGIPIGSVDQLSIHNEKVMATLLLKHGVQIHEGYTLTVCPGSLLGGNYLLITDGTGAVLPDDVVLNGEPPRNWMNDLGEIVSELRSAVRGSEIRSIITNLESTTVSIKEIAGRLEQGEGLLGKLMSDDMTVYNDLSNSVANIRSLTAKLNSGTNSLGRIVNDNGTLYDDLQTSIANLRSVSGRLENGEGTLGKLLSSDDSLYRDLKDSLAHIRNVTAKLDGGESTLGKLLAKDSKVYDDLEATVENLKVVTDRLKKGEGTLGKLSTDEQLYSDVKGLVRDVRQTVDNYRDTTPITAFASLLMGGL